MEEEEEVTDHHMGETTFLWDEQRVREGLDHRKIRFRVLLARTRSPIPFVNLHSQMMIPIIREFRRTCLRQILTMGTRISTEIRLSETSISTDLQDHLSDRQDIQDTDRLVRQDRRIIRIIQDHHSIQVNSFRQVCLLPDLRVPLYRQDFPLVNRHKESSKLPLKSGYRLRHTPRAHKILCPLGLGYGRWQAGPASPGWHGKNVA